MADDEFSNEDTEINKAKEILSWRPGFRPQELPSKGGPKFFGCTNAPLEENKVDKQLKQYESVLKSPKVRKASKLGKAEWIPEFGLAKVTKQAKFIQHMGRHNGQFMALNAEEALFLLDIGDIELTFKGVPISLQEAFDAIFGNEKSECTFNDFIVYSNLVKRGYIVLKHGVKRRANVKKRKRSIENNSATSSKEPKNEEIQLDDDEMGETCENLYVPGFPNELILSPNRSWYTEPATSMGASSQSNIPLSNMLVTRSLAHFPNLANPTTNRMQAPRTELLPSGIPSKEVQIDKIWFERIKKDIEHSNGKVPKYRKSLEKHWEIARRSKSWAEYKELKRELRMQNEVQLQQFHDKVNSWKFKPLMLPGSSNAIHGALQKAYDVIEHSVVHNDKSPCNPFTLRFDVYQSGPTPFKKTNPGRPQFHVVVTTVLDNAPNSNEILSLIRQANGVCVKYAVIDNGQVSYYEFEEVSIPRIQQIGNHSKQRYPL